MTMEHGKKREEKGSEMSNFIEVMIGKIRKRGINLNWTWTFWETFGTKEKQNDADRKNQTAGEIGKTGGGIHKSSEGGAV